MGLAVHQWDSHESQDWMVEPAEFRKQNHRFVLEIKQTAEYRERG